ncbi:MAG: ribonuclease E/G [Pseudomonadota bacterium]
MASTVLIDKGTALNRLARFEDSHLTAVLVEPNLSGPAPAMAGDQYGAKIVRVDHTLDAVFLTLAGGEDVFARLTADWSGMSGGASVTVRVETEARRDKRARVRLVSAGVAANLKDHDTDDHDTAFLQSALALLTPDCEIIITSGIGKAALGRHADLMGDASGADPVGALINPRAFLDHGFGEALDAALNPVVMLPGGGRLTIEETQALVAIDVDTHLAHHASRHGLRLSVNRAALAMLRHQIVLRRLSGQIAVDFLRVDKPKRQAFRDAVATALGDLPGLSRPHWTDSGLFICSRTRTGPSLQEALTETASGVITGRRLRPAVAAALAIADLEDHLRAAPNGFFQLAVPSAINTFIERHTPWLDQVAALYTQRFALTIQENPEARHVCTQIR